MNIALAASLALIPFALHASDGLSLIGIAPSAFPIVHRQRIVACDEDVAAVLSGKQPIHATLGVVVKDQDGSPQKGEDGETMKIVFLLDGGTRLFQGDGYRLVVNKRWCRIGGIAGYLIGPEVILEPPLADQPELVVSMVRFVPESAVQKKRPNQSPQRNAGAGPAGSNEASPPRPASPPEETARTQPPRG